MKIIHSHPRDEFAIVPNSTARDDRLSYRARGILSELLSRPDGWTTSADDLTRRAKRTRGDDGEGRGAILAALAELETAGYLRRTRVQGPRGRFATQVELSDVPFRRSDRMPVDRTSVGRLSVGRASSQKTEPKTETKISPPPSPPQPAVELEPATAGEERDEITLLAGEDVPPPTAPEEPDTVEHHQLAAVEPDRREHAAVESAAGHPELRRADSRPERILDRCRRILDRQQHDVDHRPQDAAVMVPAPAARGVEQEGQEQTEPRPASPRVPASPEVTRGQAADNAVTAWARTLGTVRPDRTDRARVRAGAMKLLTAGWTARDVAAAAVDMAQHDPDWKKLDKHAGHWAAAQATAAPRGASTGPGRPAGHTTDPWAPARPARPAWCGHCDEQTRLAETDDGMVRRCATCHPMATAEPAF